MDRITLALVCAMALVLVGCNTAGGLVKDIEEGADVVMGFGSPDGDDGMAPHDYEAPPAGKAGAAVDAVADAVKPALPSWAQLLMTMLGLGTAGGVFSSVRNGRRATRFQVQAAEAGARREAPDATA
jgi:predicted small secreted protein